MTILQKQKLQSLAKVLNHYMNQAGDLVVDINWGTNHFARIFIGERGGFCGRTRIYKYYDFQDKMPFGFKHDQEP